MNVLIIKITSMGDLIHTLPALTDAQRYHPGIRFDWVSDHHFAEIPSWHSAVDQVIVSAHRTWKKNPWKAIAQGQCSYFLNALRKKKYDLVIDAQASLKSALIAGFSRGPCAGMDKKSVREYGASWFYRHTYRISRMQHAIHRTRELFAAALHYPVPVDPPDFGIVVKRLTQPASVATLIGRGTPYLVFIPNASWASKLYPESQWKQLIAHAIDYSPDLKVLIPWATPAEQGRAERLAESLPQVIVLPRLRLGEMGALIYHARGVVGVDTGLTHLAGALQVPTIALYGPTDPKRVAIYGKKQQVLQTILPCVPCYRRECRYQARQHVDAVCLMQLEPYSVWSACVALMDGLVDGVVR